MNEDGRMARLDDLVKFSKKHKIKIASIADIIAYRLKTEKLVYKIFSKNLNMKRNFYHQLSIYKNKLNESESFVILKEILKKMSPCRYSVIKKISKNNLFKNIEIKEI